MSLSRRGDRIAVALLLLLHMAATCQFFPPTEVLRSEPLHHRDHAVHTRRVHVYREALWSGGLPWGYDPATAAGLVLTPYRDLGAKPQQALSVVLFFVPAGMIVRSFTFFVVLTLPLWSLLACRRLGLEASDQAWVLLALLVPTWLHSYLPRFMDWGLISHLAASYFAPYLLVLFDALLSRPGAARYWAFVLGAAAIFLLHILGPVVVLPSLILLTLGTRRLPRRWRVAILFVPLFVALLNAFWLVPALMAKQMPMQPLAAYSFLQPKSHLTTPSWKELFDIFDAKGIVIHGGRLVLAGIGLFLLARRDRGRVAFSLGVALLFALFLRYFGSFIPSLQRMQCVRFLVPAWALAALPVGLALASVTRRLRLPAGLCAAGLGVLMAGFAVSRGKPERLPLPPRPDPLGEFIARRTRPTDRLLVQSHDGYKEAGYEAQIFPVSYQREVIGNTFSDLYDPAQFLSISVWGRELRDWSPGELRQSLDRWGIHWVFTQTDDARALLQFVTGEPGESVGQYTAFRVPADPTRFLIGNGRIVARVNRLELTGVTPENGLVVLRYRYHPAWQAEGGLAVEQYSIPEDPKGFIALRNPPRTLTLRFNSAAMLNASWPE